MSTSARAVFEAVEQQERPYTYNLERGQSGNYRSEWTQYRWDVWKKAWRAAIAAVKEQKK